MAKSTRRIPIAIRRTCKVVKACTIWHLLPLIVVFAICKTEAPSYRTNLSIKVNLAQNDGTKQLVSGSLITGEISGNEFHQYQTRLKLGQYFQALLIKGDLNMSVSVYGPDGQKCAEFVSRRFSPLRVSLIAEDSGMYKLEIRSLEVGIDNVHYELKIERIQIATEQDQKYLVALSAVAEADKLRQEWLEESLRKSIDKYSEAGRIWQTIGDLSRASEALESNGEVHFTLSEYYLAIESYKKALVMRQALNDRLGKIAVLNSIGYTYIYLGENQTALQYIKKALACYKQSGLIDRDREIMRREAELSNSFGELYYSLSIVKKALDSFNKALALWTTVGDRRGQALAHLNIGYMNYDFGDMNGALDQYNQALAIWRNVNDSRGVALSRTAIGAVNYFLGEKQSALDSHNEALLMFRAIGEKHGQAATLNGIGTAYAGLNKSQIALDSFNESLKLYRAIGNRDFEALTRFYIGWIYRSLGQNDLALDEYKQSLLLLRKVGDRRIETYVLKDIGTLYLASGEKQKALSQYYKVLGLYNEFEDRRGRAGTLNSIGDIYYSLDERQKALIYYNQALPLSQAAEDIDGQILALYNMARVERDLNNSKDSLSHIESSIRIIENLRAKVVGHELRASYFASVHRHYELYIDLLMRMHKQDPADGFAAVALYVSECARARSLLEMLTEAKANIYQDASPDLIEREQSLQQLLNIKAEYQMQVLSGKHTKDDVAEISREMRELTTAYQEVQARLRQQSQRYASLTQPPILRLESIQAELADDDTILLEYALGDERSYLWAVTRTSLLSYELPNRATIEELARAVYNLIIARQPVKGETLAEHQERVTVADREYKKWVSELSQVLLGQVSSQLLKKRLLIVTEGALQYIPFEALLIPGLQESNEGQADSRNAELVPLVLEHEVVYLQSASLLAALRQNENPPEFDQKVVAVLADPVFERDDPRIISSGKLLANNATNEFKIAQLHNTLRDFGELTDELTIPRLLGTRQEANAIMAVTKPGKGMVATDFRASRVIAVSDEVSKYQILHFATHCIINDEQPELSGIILSLVDEQGNLQDGFLRLHDIYNLRLQAKLIVLSACKTGLGKNIQGEGRIGLIRGFMYAGSKSVVASLWKVDDEATCELMKPFYKAMLEEGLPPAAALQKAKQSLLKQQRWQSPYYWAAFVLQGEYNERFQVDSNNISAGAQLGIFAFIFAFSLTVLYLTKRVRRKAKKSL